MQRCNAERFGGRRGSIRVNRLAEAESARTNSSSRSSDFHRCFRIPQRRITSQGRPARPMDDRPARSTSSAIQSTNSGCWSRTVDIVANPRPIS